MAEVAIRAKAFGMVSAGFDVYWDEKFAQENGVKTAATLDELLAVADYISLHTNLTPETRDMINAKSIAKMKEWRDFVEICARGEIVNTADMVAALQSGRVSGYGADVLDVNPPPADHPLLKLPNVVITPHVASRTYESVVRQATTSVKNLILAMNGEKPIAQVNPGGEGGEGGMNARKSSLRSFRSHCVVVCNHFYRITIRRFFAVSYNVRSSNEVDLLMPRVTRLASDYSWIFAVVLALIVLRLAFS